MVWEVDIEPVAQAVVTGKVAVVIVRARGDELDIAGFDVQDGEELWRHPYIPGFYPIGYGIEPAVIQGSGDEEYVVFQRPEGALTAEDWYSPVVAVDPKTGHAIHQSPPMIVNETWDPCADDADACASGRVPGAEERQRLRFHLRDGSITVDSGWPADVREIGERGLYSTSDRPRERIGRVVGGEVKWERPAEDVFGPGYGTDGGWAFWYDEDKDLYVGTIGQPLSDDVSSRYQAGRPVTVSASNSQTLAFEASTGERLWATPGTTTYCVLGGGDLESPEAAARCEFSGDVTIRNDADPKYRNVEGAIEGFDLRTGTSTWRDVLSSEGARELVEVGRGIMSDENRLIDTPEGIQLLALEDGSTTSVDEDAPFLCNRLVTFDYALAYGNVYEHRPGGTVAYPCNPSGSQISGESAGHAVSASGLESVGGMVVFAEEDRLVGYRIPASD